MYKQTSRFRQTLARKGHTLTDREIPSPRRRFAPTTALARRLDKEVKQGSRAPQQETKPQLVKRPRQTDPAN
jgi:hypothetical protein